jgi:hercynylcysteine S-oxide lyase
LTVLQRLENGEANVAARVGYSVALGEHLAAGPDRIRARLAELGHATRTALADAAGWRVVEPVGEPTAITTLAPLDGADPQKVRWWLIAERKIVTTCAEVQHTPFELHAPVLLVSPYVDTTAEELETFHEALAEATELSS